MDLPFIGQIATQGVLGVLLAISIFANWYFVKTIQAVNDKRIDDAKELSNKLLDPINAVKQNSELLIALFTRFLQGSGKS